MSAFVVNNGTIIPALRWTTCILFLRGYCLQIAAQVKYTSTVERVNIASVALSSVALELFLIVHYSVFRYGR